MREAITNFQAQHYFLCWAIFWFMLGVLSYILLQRSISFDNTRISNFMNHHPKWGFIISCLLGGVIYILLLIIFIKDIIIKDILRIDFPRKK